MNAGSVGSTPTASAMKEPNFMICMYFQEYVLAPPMKLPIFRTPLGASFAGFRFICTLLAFLLFPSSRALAIPINIDATTNIDLATAIVTTLPAGSYDVTPVDILQGGLFTAARRFGVVLDCAADGAGCFNGWEHSYYLAIGDASPVPLGCGEGNGPLPCGAYYATEALAFANAVSTKFTLSSESAVRFYWFDDILFDNAGGISLRVTPSVTAIPEPPSAAIVALGLMMFHKRLVRHVRPV